MFQKVMNFCDIVCYVKTFVQQQQVWNTFFVNSNLIIEVEPEYPEYFSGLGISNHMFIFQSQVHAKLFYGL